MSMTSTTLDSTPDGHVLLPSCLKGVDGRPRFRLMVPQVEMKDPGIRNLVQKEVFLGGFEIEARRFFDAHLRPGDAFIDVGAHMGVFTLSAVTAARDVHAVAIEPFPVNLSCLQKSVLFNKMERKVTVVAAAVSDRAALLPLHTGHGTMGSSLMAPDARTMKGPQLPLHVPTLALDDLLAGIAAVAGRRLLVKVDVEGAEPQVVAGAAGLLDAGRIAVLMLERNAAYPDPGHHAAFQGMLDGLSARGFTLWRFSALPEGGPLEPFLGAEAKVDILALAPGFEPVARFTPK